MAAMDSATGREGASGAILWTKDCGADGQSEDEAGEQLPPPSSFCSFYACGVSSICSNTSIYPYLNRNPSQSRRSNEMNASEWTSPPYRPCLKLLELGQQFQLPSGALGLRIPAAACPGLTITPPKMNLDIQALLRLNMSS